MSACIHEGHRCWPCMTGGCYDTPTEHVWWDDEDIEAAEKAGSLAPTGLCGCARCGAPALRAKQAPEVHTPRSETGGET